MWDFGCSPEAADVGKLTAESHLVQQQDEHARLCWQLLLSLVFRRAASMAWHTDYYPGRLAMLLSPDTQDHTAFEEELQVDLLAYPKAAALAQTNPFLASLVRQSFFKTVVGRELAELYATSQPASHCPSPSHPARTALLQWLGPLEGGGGLVWVLGRQGVAGH